MRSTRCQRACRLSLRALAITATLTVAVPTIGLAHPQRAIPTPEAHFGHDIGADRELVRWDGIVEYLRLVGDASDRVSVRQVGESTHGRPFLLLEISSPDTLADLDRYRELQRRLYFRDHRPGQHPDEVHGEAQRRELLDEHKAVVLITCNIHSTEVGPAQHVLELVHRLATDGSPAIRQILDNVIFLLVPSLNPDGQAMVVDWYDRFAGTDHEGGPMPWLYHPYVGHDNNRDMYMYTQQETRLIGQVLYEEWFPSIWLDEHQMGSMGPRIFVMPATDPINPNVHPLIYRLNGFYGQAQGAALEEAGKVGIVYDFTYTNFWEGAMAWTGWWHNQVGMLTELASVRVATPIEQRTAKLGEPPTGPQMGFREAFRRMMENPDEPLPPPRDVQPRTTYPRPWLGGTWTLRDIVEYQLIASLALLETAADTRRQLIEQIYEVNRSTILQFLHGEADGPDEAEEIQGAESSERSSGGGLAARPGGLATDGSTASQYRSGYPSLPKAVGDSRPGTGRLMAGYDLPAGTPYAVIVPPDQHDPSTVIRMLRLLERGGVVVERARAPFEAGERLYPEGTWVIRLAQAFGRYAKDMLEAQTYPEVRPAPSLPPQPPYDVTAWSLGMMMGVDTTFVELPFEADLEIVDGVPLSPGIVHGEGERTYALSAAHNDSFAAVNRLWDAGARVRRFADDDPGLDPPVVPGGGWPRLPAGSWIVDGVDRATVEEVARDTGVEVWASDVEPDAAALLETPRPRIAIYQPWGSNMDEGWTRWLLDRYGFHYTVLHPQDLRAAGRPPRGEPNELYDDPRYEIPAEERALWPPHVAAHAPAEVLSTPLSERFDVILFAHQSGDDIVDGDDFGIIPPLYRGGIGEDGLRALRRFLDDGGRVVAMGAATELLIDRWPIPVRDLAAGLDDDELLIPGSVVRLEADVTHPLAWGMPERTYGYFIRNPVFGLTEGFRNQAVSVPVRYPNDDLRASGWIRGPEHVQGRAAAVQVDLRPRGPGRPGSSATSGGAADGTGRSTTSPAPTGARSGGRIVLLGLRPQHRAQTHATFKLLFNALVNP